MSPTRRDVLRSVAGVAVALPLATLPQVAPQAVAAAIPASASEAPPLDTPSEPWSAWVWGEYFRQCMQISFPHYRDLSVKMVSENMVSMDGEHTHIGLTIGENGETCLFVVSRNPLDQGGLKIAMNGLAMAFAAEGE